MQNSKTIIEFKNIVKTYGVGDAKTYALDKVNFSIKEGEFVAIMGSSGSGKSTAMNMIGCLDKPTSGEYLFNGINVEKLNRNQMALLRRNYLGFIFQGFNLLGRTSALENVELPLVYRKIPAKKRKELALEALQTVGLQSVSHHTPSELSGGQQQRVAIARAIAKNPKLLLCDEPTGALDYKTGKQILKLLQDTCRNEKMTVIIITHNSAISPMADKIIKFKNGAVSDIIINKTPKNIADIEW